MRVLALVDAPLEPVTAYASQGVGSAAWCHGAGEAHVHTLRVAPGGCIGPHPTGFAQLLVPIVGAGWVSDGAGVRKELRVGEVAFIARGEMHAKGSDIGMIALMVQVRDLELATVGTGEA